MYWINRLKNEFKIVLNNDVKRTILCIGIIFTLFLIINVTVTSSSIGKNTYDAYRLSYTPISPGYNSIVILDQNINESVLLREDSTGFVFGSLQNNTITTSKWKVHTPYIPLMPARWQHTLDTHLRLELYEMPKSLSSDSFIEITFNGKRIFYAFTNIKDEEHFTISPGLLKKNPLRLDIPLPFEDIQTTNNIEIILGPNVEIEPKLISVDVDWKRTKVAETIFYVQYNKIDLDANYILEKNKRPPVHVLEQKENFLESDLTIKENVQKIPNDRFPINGKPPASPESFFLNSNSYFKLRPINFTNNFTIETVFAYFDDGSDKIHNLIAKTDYSTDNISLAVNVAYSKIEIIISPDGSNTYIVYSKNILLPYYWQHVLLSYDGEFIYLYINGELDSIIHAPIGSLYQSDQDVFIGTNYIKEGNFFIHNFNGVIHFLSFYDGIVDNKEAFGRFNQFFPITVEQLKFSEEKNLKENSDFEFQRKLMFVGPESDFYLFDFNTDSIGTITDEVNFIGFENSPITPLAYSDTGIMIVTESPNFKASWQEAIDLVYLIFVIEIIVLGIVLSYFIKFIRKLNPGNKIITLFLSGLVIRVFLGLFNATYDLQLFKFVSERFLTYGFLPPLTINGYGPFFEPTIVSGVIAYLVAFSSGFQSELLYNLYLKVPFIVGDLVLALAVFKLAEIFGIGKKKCILASLLVFFNPVSIWMSNWQAEGLVAAIAVFGLYYLFKNRILLSSLLLAVSFSYKYWSLVIMVIGLLYLIKNGKKSEVKKFVVLTAGFSLMTFIPFMYTGVIMTTEYGFDEYVQLLAQRLPVFGTLIGVQDPWLEPGNNPHWSLYRIFEGISSTLINLIIIIGFMIIPIIFFVKTRMTKYATTSCIAALLLFVTSLYSINVLNFLIWSLPFVTVLAFYDKNKALMIVPISMAILAVLVSPFNEAPSLQVLHLSPEIDKMALIAAEQYNKLPIINDNFSTGSGYVYAILGLVISLFLIIRIFNDSFLKKIGNRFLFLIPLFIIASSFLIFSNISSFYESSSPATIIAVLSFIIGMLMVYGTLIPKNINRKKYLPGFYGLAFDIAFASAVWSFLEMSMSQYLIIIYSVAYIVCRLLILSIEDPKFMKNRIIVKSSNFVFGGK